MPLSTQETWQKNPTECWHPPAARGPGVYAWNACVISHLLAQSHWCKLKWIVKWVESGLWSEKYTYEGMFLLPVLKILFRYICQCRSQYVSKQPSYNPLKPSPPSYVMLQCYPISYWGNLLPFSGNVTLFYNKRKCLHLPILPRSL